MSTIDLHMHSTYSDGTYTPSELVTYAKKKGLSAIALTDHDTIEGLNEARRQAELQNIRFIDGVEINSFYFVNDTRVNIHVLGYLFDANKMENYMEELKVLRYEHNKQILHALQSIGIELSYADLNMESDKNIITRLNFAKVLVQKGYAETVKEALAIYLHKGGAAFVEYNNHPFSVVAQKIHEAGGIVSLAHPAEYRLNDEEIESLVSTLKREGLDAIECIHPSQDAFCFRKLQNYAKQYNLFMTGGSDFHGKSEDGIELGVGGDNMLIPESFLRGICEW